MSAIRRAVISVEIYTDIKKSIFNGAWAPGERIDRKSIADKYGTSQTPVNDALNRLTGEGIIESRSGDGFFVPDYDDASLADLFTARAGLESIAARLCAEEAGEAEKRELEGIFARFGDSVGLDEGEAYLAADKRFHAAVLRISGSQRLNEVEASFGHIFRSYEHGLVRSPAETLPEHRVIVDAILSGSGKDAQIAMADHLLATRLTLFHT
ncbi:MAG: hypothetical protein CVV51_09680 [Spirochaetae bacterium HGW-Spirochaetae-7]|jgi:DNA-binding GntR family transcriptional regulator|nr:MAG: hypothetical protein CVV51_09680 [Spirochaetae bacterium HGW-Spirochaetae-7]